MNRRTLLIGLALLAFIILFLRTAWVGDDVYITLRTVDNFIHGYGLRWNIAERVQSYTHPLWMFLFTAIYLPTRDAYFTALLASFLASLATFWLVARRPAFAAFGVFTFLLSKAFVDYSAAGLENPLTHLLLVLFFIAFIEKQSDALLLSFLASLIALNRQDAILFVIPTLVYIFLSSSLRGGAERRRSNPLVNQEIASTEKRLLAMTMWHMFLGFLPILLWELFSLFYYGFPFPNTYYAKLGAGISQTALLQQGFKYFIDSFERDPLTLTVIFTGILLAIWRGGTRERLLALGSALYLGYVLSIGGDFMSGRFLTASLLVSVLLLMRLARDVSPLAKWVTIGFVILLGASASPPTYILDFNQPRFTEHDLLTGINDERAFYYPISGLMHYRPGHSFPYSEGGWVEHGIALRENGKAVVYEGNVGFTGYYAGPSVHIVDGYALCDPLLARLPALTLALSEVEVSGKWRIGHFERPAPEGYLATLRTGVNQIADPNLAAYYDALALVTRGPLFSRARLIAIWKFNTGQFDYLLSNE
jgi:arabinofuranosyltransferase